MSIGDLKFSGDEEVPASLYESARLTGGVAAFELETAHQKPRGAVQGEEQGRVTQRSNPWPACLPQRRLVTAPWPHQPRTVRSLPPAASWHHAAFHTVTAVVGAGQSGV